MKVPIDDHACIDLDAPVLPACEAFVSGSVYWLVWCDHRDRKGDGGLFGHAYCF